VVFDTNYRPAAWSGDSTNAARTITRMLEHVDVALPTFSDEQALFGDESPEASIARLLARGVSEVALKVSDDGSVVSAGGEMTHVPSVQVDTIVDTTAAGDAFNGGYLAARLRGADPVHAAEVGNAWGGLVIQYPGAI